MARTRQLKAAGNSKKRKVAEIDQSATSLEVPGVTATVFRIENGARGQPYPVFAPKSQNRSVKGFIEADGFIEVEAGQDYGMEISLGPEFDFKNQPHAALSFCIDGGNFCTAKLVASSEQAASRTDTNGGHGFRFIERPINENAPKKAREPEDLCGIIELQVEWGSGKLIPVNEQNRFGESYQAPTSQSSIIATRTSAEHNGKRLYTEANPNDDTPREWVDWAYRGNLPEPLTKTWRKQDPVYELITFCFSYRLRDYLEREGIIMPDDTGAVSDVQGQPNTSSAGNANGTGDADSASAAHGGDDTNGTVDANIVSDVQDQSNAGSARNANGTGDAQGTDDAENAAHAHGDDDTNGTANANSSGTANSTGNVNDTVISISP